MLVTQEIYDVVNKEIQQLLAEDGRPPARLTGRERLSELGVSSLMLARLLVQLESEFDVDPFAEDADLTEVRTVDQMIEVYEHALS